MPLCEFWRSGGKPKEGMTLLSDTMRRAHPVRMLVIEHDRGFICFIVILKQKLFRGIHSKELSRQGRRFFRFRFRFLFIYHPFIYCLSFPPESILLFQLISFNSVRLFSAVVLRSYLLVFRRCVTNLVSDRSFVEP